MMNNLVCSPGTTAFDSQAVSTSAKAGDIKPRRKANNRKNFFIIEMKTYTDEMNNGMINSLFSGGEFEWAEAQSNLLLGHGGL